jgi:inosine/xanthosine triphosphate pyrophosphatase family protein
LNKPPKGGFFMTKIMQINTSNLGKQIEFKRYLPNATFISIDLKEIKSQNHTLVSAYKANDIGNDILIDDTSLFIENSTVGTEIKWVLNNISNFIGKNATFICSLAIKRGNLIQVFLGEISGKISLPKGNSFGFDNCFIPSNSNKTFGEIKNDIDNPRFIAVQKFINQKPDKVYFNLPQWTGKYQ